MRARSSSPRSIGIYRCCLRCDDQAGQSSAVSLTVLVGLVVPNWPLRLLAREDRSAKGVGDRTGPGTRSGRGS